MADRLDAGNRRDAPCDQIAKPIRRWAMWPVTGASVGRQRLADRAKLVLASDPARRWTLAAIAAEVGHSPVYLTQVFQQVEGLPLYRYQLRLRLARALELLPQYDDITSLSLDLGFYSHSHFSTAFAKGVRVLAIEVQAGRLASLKLGRGRALARHGREHRDLFASAGQDGTTYARVATVCP